MWPQIFALVFSYVVSVLTAPKPQNAKPVAFSDVGLPQTAEGSPQIWVFGDVWIGDWTVLGAGDWRVAAIRTKSGK